MAGHVRSGELLAFRKISSFTSSLSNRHSSKPLAPVNEHYSTFSAPRKSAFRNSTPSNEAPFRSASWNGEE